MYTIVRSWGMLWVGCWLCLTTVNAQEPAPLGRALTPEEADVILEGFSTGSWVYMIDRSFDAEHQEWVDDENVGVGWSMERFGELGMRAKRGSRITAEVDRFGSAMTAVDVSVTNPTDFSYTSRRAFEAGADELEDKWGIADGTIVNHEFVASGDVVLVSVYVEEDDGRREYLRFVVHERQH